MTASALLSDFEDRTLAMCEGQGEGVSLALCRHVLETYYGRGFSDQRIFATVRRLNRLGLANWEFLDRGKHFLRKAPPPIHVPLSRATFRTTRQGDSYLAQPRNIRF